MHLLLLCASLFMGIPGSGAEHVILLRRYQPLNTVEEVQNVAQGKLVAVDQEGDRLCHLRGEFTQFPGNRALGQIHDLELTRRVGTALSEELRSCGINTLLGPVLDLYSPNPVIGTRVFSSDPNVVIAQAQAFIEGLGPLLAVGKHVPGHGATLANSHLEMPQMELQEEHMRPFKILCHQLPILMVGHFEIKDLPLPQLIDKIRTEWGYRGVIMSDDLTMNALSGSLADRAVEAFLAGCDLLLICHKPDLRSIIEEFYTRVPQERILESLARIEALPLPPPMPFHSHRALAQEVATRALSPGPMEPIKGRVKVIAPDSVRSQIEEGISLFSQISFNWEQPDLIVHMAFQTPENIQGILVSLGAPEACPEASYFTYSPVPAAIEALFSRFERASL